jgi:RHS repeat-associated protein
VNTRAGGPFGAGRLTEVSTERNPTVFARFVATLDPVGNPTQIVRSGSLAETQTYTYDDEGRRIRKTVGSTTTNYLYNGPDIVAEYSSTWGLPLALYTHGPNMDDPLIRSTSATAQYYHQDGLGSVVGLTNQTGGTDGTARYDAWGNTLASTGPIPLYGYSGREPDETGLLYYRARYYDPTTGRFLQRDPIELEEGDLHPYAYVDNNPTNLVDPDGTLAFFWHSLISSGAGLKAGTAHVSNQANLVPNPLFHFSNIYMPLWVKTMQGVGPG